MNVALLQRIKRRILRNPQAFRMDHWNCGTAACIAGHACAMNGFVVTKHGWLFDSNERVSGIESKTMTLLGINDEQFVRLCEWDPTAKSPEWPEPFRTQFNATRFRKRRARIAARRIDHFIATNGAE